jgi:mannose-6-phosphate isomerase-like protein (cupin superfamily)
MTNASRLPLDTKSAQDPRVIPVIDVESKRMEIDELWSPIDVALVNDQVVRMALCLGEYHWHRHENEDELFYVYRGRLVIEMKEHPDITLHTGELAVIPKDVEHRPVSDEPTYVMLFEPHALKSRGD